MDEHATHPPHPTRGTIDSRDHFIEGLYRILENPPEGKVDRTKEIFLAFSQLVEWSQRLAGQLEAFTVSLSSSGSRQEEALKQLYVKWISYLSKRACLVHFLVGVNHQS